MHHILSSWGFIQKNQDFSGFFQDFAFRDFQASSVASLLQTGVLSVFKSLRKFLFLLCVLSSFVQPIGLLPLPLLR